jgi:hypothetical protein
MRKKINSTDGSVSTGLLDILFILLLTFVALFIISFIMINPITKQEGFTRKAEYIIELEWDDISEDDVDLHIRDPLVNYTWFQRKRTNLVHLDMDDTGTAGDTVVDENGNFVYVKINREIGTIRGIIPGTFTVNVHMYTKRDANPVKATVNIYKVNPYAKVATREVRMLMEGEEHTIASFEVTPDGYFRNVSYDQDLFIKEYMGVK